MMNYQILSGLVFLASQGKDFDVLSEAAALEARETLISLAMDADEFGTNHVMNPEEFMMLVKPWHHGSVSIERQPVPATEGKWAFPSLAECKGEVEGVLSQLWGPEWLNGSSPRCCGLDSPTSVGVFIRGVLRCLEMGGGKDPKEEWAHWYILALLCRGLRIEFLLDVEAEK